LLTPGKTSYTVRVRATDNDGVTFEKPGLTRTSEPSVR
jgi:hypothetical protein